MKNIWFGFLLLAFILVSALQAQEKVISVKTGVRYPIGVWATTALNGQAVKSEFTGLGVVEAYFVWYPSWYGVEVSGQIGNSTAYVMDGVSEMSAPTLTLKAHKVWGLMDVNLALGAGFDSVSGKYMNKYPVSGGGVMPVIQLGTDFLVFKGLSLGLDLKFTSGAPLTVEWDKNTKTGISKWFTPSVGIGYQW